MKRQGGWRRVLLGLCLLVAATLPADVLHFQDGTKRQDLWIGSVQGGQNGGTLSCFTIERGDIGESISFELSQVKGFELREPTDVGPLPEGRVGHITSTQERTLYNATIEGMLWERGKPVLRFRRVGIPVGGTSGTIELAQLAEARMGPIPIGVGSGAPPSIGGGSGTGSYLDDGATAPEGPGTLAPSADPSGTARSGPVTPEQLLDDLTRGSGTPGQPSSPFLIKPMPEENPFSLQGQGVFVIFGLMGGLMLLTFVTGTFALLFSAKNVGIADLTLKRAAAASALLAIIPPTLFALCYLAIPVFIALKLFAGVSLFYLSARMIIMGFLEVLEDKATQVFISFYICLITIVAIGWGYVVSK